MIELWSALDNFYTAYATTAALRTLLSGGLHNTEAPQGVSFPYGVFHMVSDVPDNFASDKNYMENCLVQFNLFSKKKSMVELLSIYDEFVSCFDFLDLSIDGYTTSSCVRQNTISFKVEGVWQINVSYRLLLEPN